MQLLRRSDSNSRPNVRPFAGVPDHQVSKKQTNEEWININVRTVTSSLHSNEGITPWIRYKYEVKYVDLTPVRKRQIGQGFLRGNGVNVTVWRLQNKLSTAYPTGGHVTQLEHHRRGRPVLLGLT